MTTATGAISKEDVEPSLVAIVGFATGDEALLGRSAIGGLLPSSGSLRSTSVAASAWVQPTSSLGALIRIAATTINWTTLCGP